MAATPAWFADNVTLIALTVLVVLTVLVLRLVGDMVVRTILLLLIAGVAVFTYVNRDPLKACATTCECELVGQDVSVPFCDPDLELSARITLAPRRA